MKQVNVAIAGSWAFHAEDFVRRHRDQPGVHFIAAWDSDPVKGKAWAEELALPFVADYDELLALPGLHAVILTSATALHEEMSLKAILADKHVIVEKAPMTTLKGALAVKKALEEHPVRYMVSDPVTTPQMLKLKEMADQGLFGEITTAFLRNAHDLGSRGILPDHFFRKEEAFGGAAMDLGCHGAHRLAWLLGKPVASSAMFSSIDPRAKRAGIEDNAAVLYRFESGAIGIASSSWNSPREQSLCSVYGTRGCIHMISREHILYCLSDGVWHTMEPEALPPMGKKPMELWFDTLTTGAEHPEYGVDEAMEMTKMLTAACRSAEKTVRIE